MCSFSAAAGEAGERSQQKVYGLALAQAGFVCLATDYRLSSEASWPAQLDDVKNAIRWLRKHSEEFRIDPERIAVSGNSSGGHLALMAAATGDAVPASQDEVDAGAFFEWGERSLRILPSHQAQGPGCRKR